MDQQTFRVTWKMFKKHLDLTQQDLFQEKHFADVTLVSEDQIQLTAHKVVLSACSPVLRNLLLNNPHPHPLLYMRGIKHHQLQSLLQFMYIGEARISQDQIDEFIAIGKDLEVKDLSDSFKVDVQYSLDKSEENFDNNDVYEEGTALDFSFDNNDSDVQAGNDSIPMDHQETKPKTEFYCCNSCEFKTISKGSLKIHTEAIHDGIRYGCDQCNYMATKRGNLKRHKQLKHEDNFDNNDVYEKEMELDSSSGINDSSIQVENKTNSIEHQQTESKPDIYFCNLCEFKTTSKGSLKIHTEAIHDGIRYGCDQCDYMATKQGNLRRHKQVKHEDTELSCDRCEFKTKLQENLNRHVQSQHDGVKYSCDLCDYKGSRQEDVNIHKRIKHEGVKYSCNKCEYQTGWLKNIKRHRELKHSKTQK